MNQLWYATTNPGKVVSLRRRLRPVGFRIKQWPGVSFEPRFDSVASIARLKVMFAFHELRQPVVALDAGFYIHGLDGFPATFVNFSLRTIQLGGILRLADMTDRRCEFRHALAYQDDRNGPVAFEDAVHGTVAPEPRGHFHPSYHWSELVTIFVPDGQAKTLGEMSRREYINWNEHHVPGPRYAEQFLSWFRHYRLIAV